MMFILRSGIDLVEIDRLARLAPPILHRFKQRVYTPREIEESGDTNKYFAGRFAAKEAVSKALGCGIGKVHWQDIEILHGDNGNPILYLHAEAEIIASELTLQTWSISITHTDLYAAAVAIGIGEERS